MARPISPQQIGFAELLDQAFRQKFPKFSRRSKPGTGNAHAAEMLRKASGSKTSGPSFRQWRKGLNLPRKEQIEPLIILMTHGPNDPMAGRLRKAWADADAERTQRRKTRTAPADMPLLPLCPDAKTDGSSPDSTAPPEDSFLSHRHLLRIGATRTLWEHRLGHGEPIPWDHIRCRIDREDVQLNREFEPLLAEEKRHIAENPRLFDGHQLALRDINEYRSDNEERYIDVLFARSRYSQFRAINVNPIGRIRRIAFLANWSVLGTPIDWLSLGVGVHICVFTSDDFIVAVRRAEGIRVREKEHDFGVVEGLSQHLDSFEADSFSLQAVTVRAIREEFGLLPEDIDRSCCTGLGYDLHYSQWNVLGAVHTNLRFDEVEHDRFVQFAKTKFEIAELVAVPNDLEEIKRFVRSRRIWSSGMACIYYALIVDRGSAQKVHHAFKGYVMDDLQQYTL